MACSCFGTEQARAATKERGKALAQVREEALAKEREARRRKR